MTVTPDQQQAFIDCLVVILETANHKEDETVVQLFFQPDHTIIPLAIQKWASREGEQQFIAQILWKELPSHTNQLSWVQSCMCKNNVLCRVTTSSCNIVFLHSRCHILNSYANL